MDAKANILNSNVGCDEAKFTLSYFVTDCGSMESAEEIKKELDAVISKHGGTPKE
jgi:hypothetical protein